MLVQCKEDTTKIFAIKNFSVLNWVLKSYLGGNSSRENGPVFQIGAFENVRLPRCVMPLERQLSKSDSVSL